MTQLTDLEQVFGALLPLIDARIVALAGAARVTGSVDFDGLTGLHSPASGLVALRLGAGSAQFGAEGLQVASVQSQTPVAGVVAPSANQSVANNSWLRLVWGSELYNWPSSPLWDGGAPGVMRCPLAGLYWLQVRVQWAAHSTGDRVLMARRNAGGSATGGSYLVADSMRAVGTAGFTSLQGLVGLVALETEDTVEIFALQNSGGGLNVLAEGTQVGLVRV